MQVLKLLQDFNHYIISDIQDEIGYGADGQLFSSKSSPNKIIKLSIFFEDDISNNFYNQFDENISYIEKNKPDIFVNVLEHGFLKSGLRTTCSGEQKYIIYYCVMERLNKISEDEKKVFHSILSHEDLNKIKSYKDNDLKKILIGMNSALDFDINKVFSFYKKIQSSSIKHLDIHVRNIMKDNLGNFKLIDLDRLTKEIEK